MTDLTVRLQALVDASKKVNTTTDIGCDHGFVGTELLKRKKTKFLIASDISKDCAQKTQILLKKENLENQADVRVGDGIVATEKEKIDQAIIAGMGGKEIVHILQNPLSKKIDHFVLQPMNELVFLRSFLNQNGFVILKDFIKKDKQKFYHIITASFGTQKLSLQKIKWGAKPHKNDDFFEWLSQKQQKIEQILQKLPPKSPKKTQFLLCLKEIKNINTKRSKKC